MSGQNSLSGARGVQGQSLDCSHELLAGWGWKSVKDQCKVLSASLIGTGRVVLDGGCRLEC